MFLMVLKQHSAAQTPINTSHYGPRVQTHTLQHPIQDIGHSKARSKGMHTIAILQSRCCVISCSISQTHTCKHRQMSWHCISSPSQTAVLGSALPLSPACAYISLRKAIAQAKVPHHLYCTSPRTDIGPGVLAKLQSSHWRHGLCRFLTSHVTQYNLPKLNVYKTLTWIWNNLWDYWNTLLTW